MTDEIAKPYSDDEVAAAEPVGAFRQPFSPFAHLATDYLKRAQKDLRSHIPSDPTFLAHVSNLFQALIAHDLRSPERVALDTEAKRAREQPPKAAQLAEEKPADAVNV